MLFKSILVKPTVSSFGKEFDHLQLLELQKHLKQNKPLHISKIEIHYLQGKEIKGIDVSYEGNNYSHSALEDRNEKLTKETLSIDADDWIYDISVGVGEHLLNTMIMKTVKGKYLKSMKTQQPRE